MRIHLDANETYSVEVVAELLGQAINFIGEHLSDREIEFSSSDIYWTLHSLLSYVNERVKGEFALRRLKKGSWALEYTDEKAANRKAAERHRRELRRTADHIENLTGHRPPWG
jgi:hypothetical protein